MTRATPTPAARGTTSYENEEQKEKAFVHLSFFGSALLPAAAAAAAAAATGLEVVSIKSDAGALRSGTVESSSSSNIRVLSSG